MMTQQSGHNWTQRQFQGAWLGLAIAEAMIAGQSDWDTSSSSVPAKRWVAPRPSSALSQPLASDCSAHLPLTAQAVRLGQHLIDSLHPRQPGLSWLDIQTKYVRSAEPKSAVFTEQAVTLLPLWLLVSDRPAAIAYIAQQIQAADAGSDAALSLTLTALTLRYLLAHPLASSRCGYSPPTAVNPLLNQIRSDLDWVVNGLQNPQLQQSQFHDEQLVAVVSQAPTVMVARSLMQSLPVELHPIATALYVLTHFAYDFTQALRCAHLLQPHSQSAIALTGIVLGIAAPLSIPASWHTAVKALTFPPSSTTLTTISQTLWKAWAGAYIPQRTG
ncbi:MAG: hypothetical protein ACTS2F_21650 [Thainema sp.]